MALDSQKIRSKAKKKMASSQSLTMAADVVGKDREDAKEELRDSIASVIENALDKLWIIPTFISSDWVATLTAGLAETFGKILLKWLNTPKS